MLVSDYFQSVPYDKELSTIWHSIFGRPMLVPGFLVDHLLNAREQKIDPDIITEFDKEVFDILEEAHIIVSSKKQEEADIHNLFLTHNNRGQNKVKYLSLIMSEECPFRCTYCIHFANSKHYYNPEKMMSEETAKRSIDEYLKAITKNHTDEAYINFGGGEPLLNYKTIEKLLPYINDYRKKLNIPIKIGLNTNLALLTKEMAKTFIKYDVIVAASLDGTKHGNDQVRLTKNLAGTYDQIIRGFNILEELGQPLKSFAMTVTEANFADVDTTIVDWAKSKNMDEIRIDIDIVGMVNVPIGKIIEQLKTVRAYAKTKGISVIGFWSRPAENLGLLPENDDIGFCGGERGNSVCVAPSGQVFPCGYSNYQMGNYGDISHIENQESYQQLLKHRDLNNLKECRKCPILGFCRGGCLITKEANETTEKQSSMCQLYVEMTKAIIAESIEA